MSDTPGGREARAQFKKDREERFAYLDGIVKKTSGHTDLVYAALSDEQKETLIPLVSTLGFKFAARETGFSNGIDPDKFLQLDGLTRSVMKSHGLSPSHAFEKQIERDAEFKKKYGKLSYEEYLQKKTAAAMTYVLEPIASVMNVRKVKEEDKDRIPQLEKYIAEQEAKLGKARSAKENAQAYLMLDEAVNYRDLAESVQQDGGKSDSDDTKELRAKILKAHLKEYPTRIDKWLENQTQLHVPKPEESTEMENDQSRRTPTGLLDEQTMVAMRGALNNFENGGVTRKANKPGSPKTGLRI